MGETMLSQTENSTDKDKDKICATYQEICLDQLTEMCKQANVTDFIIGKMDFLPTFKINNVNEIKDNPSRNERNDAV